MIEAVIFDMDGLLLDTERIALAAYVEAAANVGLEDAAGLYPRYIGRDWKTTRALMEEALGTEDSRRLCLAWTESFDRMRFRTGGIPQKRGVNALLDLLEAAGTPVALATSTAREQTLAQLEASGLSDRFPTIATGDEVVSGKPAPDIYLLAASRLDRAPAACVALEDSEPGVEAARAAGMRVIMVPDLVAPTPRTLAMTERVCRSLDEARAFISARLSPTRPG
jgi:HAD superfamily hydrolase (TIGR01509 family)